jgi:hypothetical protein
MRIFLRECIEVGGWVTHCHTFHEVGECYFFNKSCMDKVNISRNPFSEDLSGGTSLGALQK